MLRAGVAPHQLQPAAPRIGAPVRQQLQLACGARAPSLLLTKGLTWRSEACSNRFTDCFQAKWQFPSFPQPIPQQSEVTRQQCAWYQNSWSGLLPSHARALPAASTCVVVVVVEPAVDDHDVAWAGGAPQEGYEPRQHLVQVVLPDEHEARVLAQVKVPPAARAGPHKCAIGAVIELLFLCQNMWAELAGASSSLKIAGHSLSVRPHSSQGSGLCAVVSRLQPLAFQPSMQGKHRSVRRAHGSSASSAGASSESMVRCRKPSTLSAPANSNNHKPERRHRTQMHSLEEA